MPYDPNQPRDPAGTKTGGRWSKYTGFYAAVRKGANVPARFNGGRPYARRTHTENTPMSEWGHAMFADDLEKIQESYGPNVWEFDANAHGEQVADIEDIKNDIWDAFLQDVERGYYNNDINDEVQNLIDMYNNGEMTKDQFLDGFSPRDIVDTALAYDSVLGTQWLYDRVLERKGITAVVLPDGAVVFDKNLITRFE